MVGAEGSYLSGENGEARMKAIADLPPLEPARDLSSRLQDRNLNSGPVAFRDISACA
jgi:hypothetical protein